MITVPRALPSNRLVNSRAYPKILSMYNDLLTKEGRVNAKKFYEQFVKPEIPSYGISGWYDFLKRYKTPQGLVATSVSPEAREDKEIAEGEHKVVMLTNQEATARLISGILNISAAAALEIVNDPSKLTPEKRIELGLKAMRSQDSRIHAVGKLREDNREQERFDAAFAGSSYEE